MDAGGPGRFGAGGSGPVRAPRPCAGTARAPPAPFFAGVRGGVGRLPLELAGRLTARGVDVRTGTTVRELQRTPAGWRLVLGRDDRPEMFDVDAVVLAVPPSPAARLLDGACPAAAALLAEVETASMAVVAMLVPRAVMDGVPGVGGARAAGRGAVGQGRDVLVAKWGWTDELDPELVVVRASLGRLGEEAVLQRDDDEPRRGVRRPTCPTCSSARCGPVAVCWSPGGAGACRSTPSGTSTG